MIYSSVVGTRIAEWIVVAGFTGRMASRGLAEACPSVRENCRRPIVAYHELHCEQRATPAPGTEAGGRDPEVRATMARIGHPATDPVTGGWTVELRGGVPDAHFTCGIGGSGMKAGEGAEASP